MYFTRQLNAIVGVAFEVQVFEHWAQYWKVLTVVRILRILFGIKTHS